MPADRAAAITAQWACGATVAPAASLASLGCGNPVAIGRLKEGETVLDLGSGGGFDSFLAAKAVGPRGRVIGVNSQIISPSRASAGIGFAVSSNTVLRVVPELIARGYYPHAWLGMSIANCSLTVVQVRADGSTKLIAFADSGHIPYEMTTYPGTMAPQ